MTQELPPELPMDLKAKFEVRDVEAAPAVQPELTAAKEPESTAPAKKKRAKASKKAKKEPGAKAPFEYPKRRPEKEAFFPGEQQVFEITYFGMAAGDFTLDVLPYKVIDNRKVYHIRGTAVSSSIFSLFYRINDTIETFIDYDGLFSHRFHLILDETKQTRDALELYDSEKGQTFYWNRWNHKERGFTETKEFQPMQSFSQDSLSALFYLRSIPLNTGEVVSFPVVSEGKTWEAVVTVVRRETIDGPNGPMQTVVVKPETKFQGVAQKRGDSFIWLSDDERRYIVRLEAKVKVGTVVARLKKIVPGTTP
jgi:hypothetical protein